MDNYEDRSLHERIERLESVVEELRHSLEHINEVFAQKDKIVPAETVETVPPPEPAVLEAPETPLITVLKPADTIPETPVPPRTLPSGVTRPEPERTSAARISTKPSRTREEWEVLIGGKILNRIGALALIIGIGFFMKYAFDNNWISETVRVLIGGGIGVLLLFGGWRFHRQGLQIFAQGLVGAGISILYLSVYASFNFYQLIPQAAAFVFMSIVTVLTFHQAIHYDSLSVAFLGWVGGFLTPFLLSTGYVNEVGLFSYIVFLDAGLIVVLMKKTSWAILELLTLAATYCTYFLWYVSYYTAANLPVTVVFLTLFWGMFYVLDISRIIKPVTSFPLLRQTVSALNAVFYYWAIYAVINPDHHAWMAPVTLLIGIVYFLTLQWSQRCHAVDEGTRNRYALTAGALLIIATGIQLSGFMRVAVWSIEGLMLVWYGSSENLRYVWRAAIALFAFYTISLYSTQFPNTIPAYKPVEGIRFLFNSRALAFAALAASLGFSVLPLRRLKEDVIPKVQRALHYWWCIVLFVLCTVEAYDYFADSTVTMILLMIALSWVVYSLPVAWSGLRTRVEPVLTCGYFAAFFAVVTASTLGFVTFDPLMNYRLALNTRAVVLVLIGAGTYFHTQWLKRIWNDYMWSHELNGFFQIALVIIIFSLITGETKDFFAKSIFLLRQGAETDVSSEINQLANLRQLSLSGVWLLYSILLMGFGMWRRLQGLRIVAIALFGFTILKIFIYDLSFLDSLYRIFSFVGLGCILLAASYMYQRYKAVIFT